MTGAVLRVGVVTSRPIAVWQALCVEQLAAVPGVAITRWLERASSRADPPPAQTGPRSAGTVPHALTYLTPVDADDDAALVFWPGDRRRLGTGPQERRPASRAPDDLQSWAPGAPDLGQSGRGHSEVASSNTVDLLLDLTAPGIGLQSWAGEVWRFGFGPTLTREAARAAIVDYVRGAGMTRAALVREGDGELIREGWLRTITWWRGELLDSLLASTTSWPATAALERIDSRVQIDTGHSRGVAMLQRRTLTSFQEWAPMPAILVGTVGRRIIGTANSMLRQPDWHLGIMDAPIERILSAETPPPITWLPNRVGHYAADPFAVERGGVLYVLFEDYDKVLGIGSIQYLSIGADGRVSDPEAVLDTGLHTSYPFLLEHDGSVFMLPETSAAGELVLFEAEQFPSRWRRVTALLPGIPVVDASVIDYEGRWWMFATRSDYGDNHNLFIWHAPELTGPWLPHFANPVKTDVRSSRSGGTPFVVDGTLYRPTQDGSRVYGGRVVVNRVDVLTPRAFGEQPVAILEPQSGSAYPDGLHTLSAAGSRTIVDGNAMHLAHQDWPRVLERELRLLRRRWTPGSNGR
jgi:hypothetical protein